MHAQPHVRQGVFYFRPVVKAEATNKFVAQSAPPEHLFECPRLEICTVLDRAGLVRIVVEYALELTRDILRFGPSVTSLEILEVRAFVLFRRQYFSQPLRFISDDRPRRIKNLLRR